MDDSIPRSIIILVLLLISAAFFAASETAFSYSNVVRMRILAEDGNKRAKRVVFLTDSFDRTVVSINIAINIVHVIASSLATVMAVKLMGDIGSVISTVIMTIAVFLFCETIPKNMAKTNADTVALLFSLPIRCIYYIVSPLSILFLSMGKGVKKMMKIKNDEPALTGDEFASIVDNVEDEGLIEHEETEIIKSAIEFGDLTAKDVMVKRETISAIPINADNKKIKQIVFEEKYSRFPVYDGNIDHIVGILQSTAFLWHMVNKKPFKMKSFLTRPYFVSPDTGVGEIFEGMGKKRTHLAIVQSTEGTTLGLIAMEDILEEIVGEIYDEDDEAVIGEGDSN